MAPAVLLKGKSLLEDLAALGQSVETTVFKHLVARCYRQNLQFSYRKNKQGHEVDFVGAYGGALIPFEVKCRGQHTNAKDLPGLMDFLQQKNAPMGENELAEFML